MARLTIWYSIQNGGDGSAYPRWFKTKKLAEMDQEMMDEGWGEPCLGSITFESDSEIRCLAHVDDEDKVIEDLDEIINDKWYSEHAKKRARKHREELRPTEIKRNITEEDPWGEEVEEKLKSFNELIEEN
jgi:hypothetical protein